MTEIETLIPHRSPFLFVDEIESANESEIVGVKVFDDSFVFAYGHFPGRNTVPGVVLVESMGQCGGAGIKKLGLGGDGLFGFASFENVQFFAEVPSGATVRFVIKNLKVSGKVIKQSGEAVCEGKTVVRATWICVRLN